MKLLFPKKKSQIDDKIERLRGDVKTFNKDLKNIFYIYIPRVFDIAP